MWSVCLMREWDFTDTHATPHPPSLWSRNMDPKICSCHAGSVSFSFDFYQLGEIIFLFYRERDNSRGYQNHYYHFTLPLYICLIITCVIVVYLMCFIVLCIFSSFSVMWLDVHNHLVPVHRSKDMDLFLEWLWCCRYTIKDRRVHCSWVHGMSSKHLQTCENVWKKAISFSFSFFCSYVLYTNAFCNICTNEYIQINLNLCW